LAHYTLMHTGRSMCQFCAGCDGPTVRVAHTRSARLVSRSRSHATKPAATKPAAVEPAAVEPAAAGVRRWRLDAGRSDAAEEDVRVLDAVGDEAQEAAGHRAVADAVVEGERELGDLADGELPVDDPRLVDDPPDAEH